MGVCKLVSLTTSGDCVVSDGGIEKMYITESENITDIAVDVDGQITGFTMASLGKWIEFTPDDDDTAFYNETGERTGNRHVMNQQSFIKYSGIDNTRIQSAKGIKNCCSLVAIIFGTTGERRVQGVDIDDAQGWRLAKTKAKATVSILSDTGENENRVEITIDSVGREPSALTTLDEAAIIAL